MSPKRNLKKLKQRFKQSPTVDRKNHFDLVNVMLQI